MDYTLNAECGDAKTISLGRVRKMVQPVRYAELKNRVDELCGEIETL